jgi:replication-associated recombination protein RarA
MQGGNQIVETVAFILVNGDARRALNTLEMMADMAESDDAGKRVLKAEPPFTSSAMALRVSSGKTISWPP